MASLRAAAGLGAAGLIAVIVIIFFSSGGYENSVNKVVNPGQSAENQSAGNAEPTAEQPIEPVTVASNQTTVKIASWNIENFGKTKASDQDRMQTIASIIKEYDVIALQEISNLKEASDAGCARNEGFCPGDASCGLIENALSAKLPGYKFAFSPQVKDERYLFIYNPGTVTLIGAELVKDSEESGSACDPSETGKMVRQPFKGVFKAGEFDFVLLTAHTSPSDNIDELEGLAYFYREVEKGDEKDIIILGDLNADCSYLRNESITLKSPEFTWIVDDSSDTTVAQTNCAYDRFIFKDTTKEDFTGNWGIVSNIGESVSDHYLVWAEFYTTTDTA